VSLIDSVTQTSETPEEQLRRYELTLKAIAGCPLTGVDYGDWVQSVVEDAISGLWPECWNCGTYVHDGPCAGEDEAGDDEA
jgi:hypothetical protein